MPDLINVGAFPGDNTGDKLRESFIKVNSLATLLAAAGYGENIVRVTGNYVITLADNGKTIFQVGSGVITIPDSLTTTYAGLSVTIKNGGANNTCTVRAGLGVTVGGVYAGETFLLPNEQCTVANIGINRWSYTGANADRLGLGKKDFNYAALPNYLIDYDVSDAASITSSGGLVSAIANKGLGGSDYNMAQATSGLRPALIANGIGTKSVLRFDGVDDYLSCSVPTAAFYNSVSAGANGYTIFAVIKNSNLNASGGTQRFFSEGRSNLAGATVQIGHGSSGGGIGRPTPYFGRFNGANSEVFGVSTENVAYDGLPSFVCLREIVGASNTIVETWVNGILTNTATGTLATAIQTDGQLALGALFRSTVGNYYAGDIAQFIGYDTALTNVQVTDILATLAEKWKTPEPVRLYVQKGQSNSDARALDAELSSAITTFTASTASLKIKMWYKLVTRIGNFISNASFANDGRFWLHKQGHNTSARTTDMVIGDPNSTVAIQSAGKCGSDLAYAYNFNLNNPTKDLFIIKFGVGGSSIGETGWDVVNKGNMKLWTGFLEYVYIPAVKCLQARGLSIEEVVVFWMQGESDQGLGSGYATPLNTLCDRLNNELGAFFTNTSMPVKIVIGGLFSNKNAGVRSAQASVAAARLNAVLVPTDGSVDFAGNTTTYLTSDGTHYTTASIETLGLKVYQAAEYLRTLE